MDLQQDDIEGSAAAAAGEALAHSPTQPASARPESSLHNAPALLVQKATLPEPEVQPNLVSEPHEEQPLWMQLLTDEQNLTMDDEASGDSAPLSPAEESPMWLDFLGNDETCPMYDEEDDAQSLASTTELNPTKPMPKEAPATKLEPQVPRSASEYLSLCLIAYACLFLAHLPNSAKDTQPSCTSLPNRWL